MPVFTLSNFQDKLRIDSYSLNLGEMLTNSQTAGGQILVASKGNRLWQGSISLGTYDNVSQSEFEAYVSQIINPGNLFEFTPIAKAYPANDPTGSKLGSSTPTLTGTAVGYTCTIANLPASYKITAGDYFSYMINGVSRINRFTETKTATAGGNLTAIRMEAPFTLGQVPTASTAITLIRPKLTCQYMPGSISWPNTDRITSGGASFNFIQAIRLT